MNRALLALGFYCLTSIASGAMVMDGWSHYLQPNTVTAIPLLAYGEEGDSVLGMDLYVQIGDGGSEPPTITNLDVATADALFRNPDYPPFYESADPRTWLANVTSEARLPVRHNVIAWLTIDTTGAQVGDSFPLRLKGILPEVLPPDGFNSDFAVDPVTVQDGMLHIVGRKTMTWYGADGNWEDDTWVGKPPQTPTAGIDAIIDGPHTVTAHSPVECVNLTVSGGATLIAPSISADALIIGQGINGADGGLGSNSPSSVPEPSWIVLAAPILGLICASYFRRIPK